MFEVSYFCLKIFFCFVSDFCLLINFLLAHIEPQDKFLTFIVLFLQKKRNWKEMYLRIEFFIILLSTIFLIFYSSPLLCLLSRKTFDENNSAIKEEI